MFHFHIHGLGEEQVARILDRLTCLKRGQERLMARISDVQALVDQVNEKTNQLAVKEDQQTALAQDAKTRLQDIINAINDPNRDNPSLDSIASALTGVTGSLDTLATNSESLSATLNSWGTDVNNPLP